MKKRDRLLAGGIAVWLVLAGMSGCKPKPQGVSSVPEDGESIGVSSAESSSGQQGEHIGSISGVELDTAKNEIIFPYGRIKLAAEKEGYQGFGVVDASQKAVTNADTESKISKIDSNTLALAYQWETVGLETKFRSNADGTMSVLQSAKTDKIGISGVRFGFEIPNSYNVVIPTSNGVMLSADNPKLWSGTTRIAYPDEWNMQMLLIQGERGGLLIYAKDNATQFKALNLDSNDASFQISLETIPQAPFTQYQSFDAVEWLLVPYKGDWTAGAAVYQEFADKTFGLQALYEKSPAWAKEIQVFVLSDLDDLTMLDELAKKVTPSQTLLQYPAWRLEPYDVNYPDYTAAANAKKTIDYAHSLGFKVQLHINMNACEEGMNAYQQFGKYATLDPYTQKTFFFETSDSARDYRFAQINPASAAWRKFMVDTLVKVVKETGADALHLDQSLLCYNDGRGLVDGMTSMQGNIAYHKELAEALPNVAIGAEGITDINARYVSFAQSCTYAIDWSQRSVSETMIDQIVPLTLAVYDSYLSAYHWPGLPTTYDEAYWQSWYRACNMRCGFKPTIMRCSTKELAQPNDTMSMFLREAKWFCENKPQNLYTGWTDATMMRYRLKNGKTAEYKKDANGEVLLKDASAASSELTRFVTGVENAKLPGTISGWRYYDGEFIRGLDPNKSYLYQPAKRSMTATHISALTDNLTLLNFQENSSYTTVNFKKVADDSKLITDFMNYDGPIRVGEVLYSDSSKAEVKDGLSSKFPINLAFSNLAVYKHLGDRFLMHPPWLTEKGIIGYVYSEFDTELQKLGNATFTASVQMASAANAALSDGVTYKFFIWDSADSTKSNMVTKTVEVTEAIPVPVSLDITRFEGKTVTIRIEAHPGKTTANDSSVVVEPRVVQVKAQNDTAVSYTIVTEKPVLGVLSSGGRAKYNKTGTNTYKVSANLSETVYFLYDRKPSAALNLAAADFTGTWRYNDSTLSLPSAELIPRKQVAEVEDELSEGIFAHPPANGKCYVSFVVTVPSDGKLSLSGSTGLKTGSSKSDGVRFSVLADQTELWNREVKPGTALKGFEVSLSKYAGKTILLTLVTDSGRNSAYDYAFWGRPVLTVQ